MMEDGRNTPGRGPVSPLADRLRAVDWTRTAGIVIVAAAVLAAVWLIASYAAGILLPFLLAWLLSLVIRPAAVWLHKRLHVPRGLAAGLLVALLVGLSVWACAAGIRRTTAELAELVARLGEAAGDADDSSPVGGVGTVLDWLYSMSEHLPLLRRFEERPGFEDFCLWLDSAVRAAVSRAVGAVSERLSGFLMGLVSGLPSVLLFTIVLLMACFFFSADDGRLRRGMAACLPAPVRDRLPAWRSAVGDFARRWLRAYLILMLITFTEMFIGLSVIRAPYAFLMSAVIAVVDFLPVFGSGTVLIPWAVGCLVTGRTRLGLGLAVLYGVSLIVHEVLEPRLVGQSLGLHPLLSLFVMYAGLRLFGIGGMILAPVLAAAVLGAVKKRREAQTSGT